MNPDLAAFDTIPLAEMKKVKLMNRIDTKYIMTESLLARLLERVSENYLVQEIEGKLVMPYATLYYDTEDRRMYMRHLHGALTRRKVRIRRYVSSNMEFLEVKRKNNKGRTDKRRVRIDDSLTPEARATFIKEMSGFDECSLFPIIENSFSRITLVNRDFTERLTIDTGLRFHNLSTGREKSLEGLAIVELKRDGRIRSGIVEILRDLRVNPTGFSKYCIGVALTDQALPANRFKPRLRLINKLLTGNASYNR